MNHKSIAITSSLFALTLAVPPPLNSFMGLTLFVGIKMYRSALIFLGVNLFLFSGPLIGFVLNNQFMKVFEAQEQVAYQIANATMSDPNLFPYAGVGVLMAIVFELVMVSMLVFPVWVIRKKVYPRVKNYL